MNFYNGCGAFKIGMVRMNTVILFILLVSCTNVSDENQENKNESNKIQILQTDYMEMRGEIVEVSATEFRYDYYDIYEKDSHYEFFSNKGYQGGGPTWEGIIYGALKLKNPNVLIQIRFDPEGEGLAIWSSTRQPLEFIAKLVYTIKNDEELMIMAMKKAEKDGRME